MPTPQPHKEDRIRRRPWPETPRLKTDPTVRSPPKPRSVRLSASVLVWCVLTLNGCTTLGPDFEEPEVKWLSRWQPDLYGQVVDPGKQGATDLRFWWRLFDDPVLDRLIKQARQENLSLRIAGLRILESRAKLGIAASTLYPQLQQFSGAVRYEHIRRRGGNVANEDQSFFDYSTGFDLGWELDFWGRFRRSIESADAAFFASVANQQDAQVLLAAEVARLYYTHRTTELRIRIARENADIQRRSYEITELVYKSGEQSELDLQQAKTQYLATLATIPDLQVTLTKTRNALATLLGRPPGELPELDGWHGKLPAVGSLSIRDIPARLLLRRPDVRAAAWQAAAQSAQIGVAESDFYPAISLFGTIGWSGNSLDSTPNTGLLAVGPSVTWNLFDHGAIANNVRLQDARLQQLLEEYQRTVLRAAREIDDAAVTVVRTASQQRVLAESVGAARRSLDLANTRYREGYADFQRVLDAQRALFSQAERELITQGAHVGAVIELYKALGGGWLEMPLQEVVPAETRETMRDRTDWGGLLGDPHRAPAPNEQTPTTGSQQHE
ncbi:MAG: TolC family protein [Chromatiaceae bacterium]|nr:TolC family protein [Chromatiaceae bacterium]